MKKRTNRKIFNLVIDEECVNIIKNLKIEMNINVSSLIRDMLKKYYNENNKINKM